STSSLVTAMSSSSTSTPASIAYSNAGIVFSGRMARAPRCPCTWIEAAKASKSAAASDILLPLYNKDVMIDPTRRQFARAGLATAFSSPRGHGANERVRMGYIGLGNRGDQVHDAFLEHGDQQTVAVCDLKDSYMDFAVQKSRATPKKYADYRKLIE